MTSNSRPAAPESMRRLGMAAALLALATPVSAQHAHQHASPYADSGSQRVQTLTELEVTELLEGAGMGLARPAEMNGYPGPRHVLDLADELELTADQRERTQSIFDAMHGQAVDLGTRMVAMEEELDRAFAKGAGRPGLEYLVGDIAKLRGQLRWVHLQAHLEMAALLTEAQRAEYARLRGYRDGSDPPGGH